MIAKTPRKCSSREVSLGDTVRMTTTVQDATMSMVGVVARREHRGRVTEFYTKSGVLLGTEWGDGISRLAVTILKYSTEKEPQVLESFESLLELADTTERGNARKE